MSNTVCSKCILPNNYSTIIFDNEGVCNYCKNPTQNNYVGKNELISDINNVLSKYPDRKYDCVVGLSGGRDSTYLLWYVVKELNLKPLAVFVDSGFIPNQTIENIKNAVKVLNVELKIIRHKFQKHTFKWFFNAWLIKPVPETLITFCTGCRLGINKYVYGQAKKMRIPLHFEGGTPYEGKSYKKNLIRLNPNNKSKSSLVLGYIKQALLNPLLILNPYNLYIQIKEYYSIFLEKHDNSPVTYFHLFSYIRWEQKIVEKIISEELNWKKHPGLENAYRGDCEIGIIRQLLYYKLLGYNDKDDHLSCLIRDGQISREDALKRIDSEHYVSTETISNICANLNISYTKLEKILSK